MGKRAYRQQPWFQQAMAVWHVVEFLLIRIFICVVQALPLDACEKLSNRLGTFFYRVVKMRRKTTLENIQHAFPQLSPEGCDVLAERMWQHLLLLVCELAHLPLKVRLTNWRKYMRMENMKPLAEALLNDRPVMICSAHFGNFELAGYMLGVMGFQVHSVARALDNPYLDRYVTRFRGSQGQHLIPKRGGAEEMVSLLTSGGNLGILADQYAGRKGCWVDFFGRPASAHKAIAVLVMSHQTQLLVGGARRMGGPLEYEIFISAHTDPLEDRPEVANVKSLTQWYTTQVEDFIRRNPEQYWWLHNRWRDHRAPRALKVAA